MYAGVDEAGRGPVLGPLVVAGVLCAPEELPDGVADSKQLTPSTRERIALGLGSDGAVRIDTRVVDAQELNARMERGESLDEIELSAFAEVLRSLDPPRGIVDTIGSDPQRVGTVLTERVGDLTVEAKRRADASDPVVGAASIVAKVTRDRAIEKIEAEVGEPIGSGYPSDPRTRAFLERWRERSSDPPTFARTAWSTLSDLGFGTMRLDEIGARGGST